MIFFTVILKILNSDPHNNSDDPAYTLDHPAHPDPQEAGHVGDCPVQPGNCYWSLWRSCLLLHSHQIHPVSDADDYDDHRCLREGIR